jgi:hypothetical protein
VRRRSSQRRLRLKSISLRLTHPGPLPRNPPTRSRV